jgi:hypothetical protein
MKKLTSSFGGALVLISGAITWIFMMLALIQWWGLLGFIASFVFTPGVVIFPFVYWVVENQFPTNYFIAWGIGIVGLVVLAVSDK